MGKQNRTPNKSHKQKPKQQTRPKPEKKELPAHWSFPVMDGFFSKNLNVVFFLSLFLTILLGALLFDLKISEGGDDSDYIVAAKHFLEGVSFPTWHGSLYPIFLSLFVAVFGVNLFILKFLSFLCIVGHLIVFYVAFRKVIAPTFLALILIILSVNSHILYFASQTYSEAFFMLLQMISVLLMFRFIEFNGEDKLNAQKDYWKKWLGFGLFIFFIFQTRNIGVAMLLSILIFFAFEKKLVHAAFAFAGFMVFSIPFKLYKNIVWNMNEANLMGQFEIMFYKNPYNQALGKEDFGGMITRVIENSKIYLSRQLMIILGFRPEGSKATNLFLAILILALLIITLIVVYKKNRKVFFILLYTVIGIGATFVSLQTIWGQPRLIMIYVPFILVSLAWFVHYLSKSKSYRLLKFLLVGLFGFIIIKTLAVTTHKIEEHNKELKENFSGNRYYGYTPDWISFLAMSEWAGKNLPDTAVIASRKPSMSFIYSGGREFYGIYKFPTLHVNTALNKYDQMFRDLTIVDLTDMMSKNISMNLQFLYHRQSLAYVYNNQDIYGIFNLTSGQNELRQTLHGFGVKQWNSIDSLNAIVRNKDFSAVSPDSLILKLKESSVDYIIRGSLRVNPQQKTDRTINTVARYIHFIELKYPGIFEQVNQIGRKEDEPTHLFRINYSKYNIK